MQTSPASGYPLNRRRHERFAAVPMYTGVVAERPEAPGEPLDGHVYDISEGGVRFELDRAIAPGSAVTLRIDLPRWMPAAIGDADGQAGAAVLVEPKPVEVLASVIWIDDDGVPGPVRMAATFTAFLDAGDRERLLGTLAAGALRRAG
jgi:hypothetical protein